MKNRIVLLLVMVTAAGLSILASCHIGCIKGSGNSVEEKRNIAGFTKIDISGGFKITLKQDSTNSVTVNADDNLVKYIRTEVSGNKLRIYTRKNFCLEAPIVISVGINKLEEIKGAGAIELNADERLNVRNLKLDFSGASKINLDVSAADISTTVKGATTIVLKGQAASHLIKASGVAKVHAFDFIVGKYEIKTSGSGNCQINVLKSLKVNTSGVSNIEYRGNPSEVETKKSGSSTIQKVQ
jgi:hypothetical protein